MGLRRLAIAAAGVSLAVVAAVACALSYPSLHDLAVASGVRPNLAGIYPAAFDALLVIAACAVLALRGGWGRLFAWTCLVVLLAVLAGGSAVRPAGFDIPRRPAEIAAAVIPWVLVAAGLALLLLLRHARSGTVAEALPVAEAPPVAEALPVAETVAAETVAAETPADWPAALEPPAVSESLTELDPAFPALVRPHSSPTPPRT